MKKKDTGALKQQLPNKKPVDVKIMPIISKGETRTYSKDARLDLAKAYLNYVRDNKNCIQWKEFFIEQGFSTATWRRWLEIEPDLKDYHRDVLEIIGQRREYGASHNKLNYNMQIRQLHFYDEEFRNMDTYNANLRKLENTLSAEQITTDIKRVLSLNIKPKDYDDEMPE